ncbi:RimK family alpha-L-glutamate ligase [Sporosarcina contaminans]|uniref:RimK family alpha-L-glutamate ligase n=1 Tax=Sporosarcina contaminans TaxID=633403 RepID=A0ABW3TTL6_9BACL
MKGYLYYTAYEAERNSGFIDEMYKCAKKADITLRLLVEGKEPNRDADFILFRDRNSSLSKRWESEGFRVVNRSEVNAIANNKLRTYELSTILGIPTIPSKKILSTANIHGYPVVLKTVNGHGGNEVFLCHTQEQADEFFTAFHDKTAICQPYIESNAQDVRVFMIGNDVVGAVKRKGNDSFKSNYTLGGSIEKYSLSEWQVRQVQTIAKALKSDYIGIDFLLLPDGRWVLNEIEDPVGARSLYKTHDFSIAEKLIQYIQKSLSQ